MASRYFTQFFYTMGVAKVGLFGYFQVGGATGAIVNTATGSVLQSTTSQIGAGYGLSFFDQHSLFLPKGVASIVRNSVGNYTINFGQPAGANGVAQSDTYRSIEFAAWEPIVPSGMAGNTGIDLIAKTSAVPYIVPSGVGAVPYVSSVSVQFINDGYALPMDIPSGCGFRFSTVLSNSSAG
jgi:hypothetical protein